MGKQIVYTKITPLPSNVPRQLALDLLHSHKEVIEMNPLVTGVKPIEAPRTAAADEYFSNWYEITEIINWSGFKKKISFKGCFHDQPWGMQSHVFAPMGTDMRQTYRIGGNQPGEPRESRELGIDTPIDGLYLREDVNIICQVPFTAGFVKKEMKEASAIMIDRMRRKAELLDEGKLHAMFEDGKLRTAKPSGESTYGNKPMPSPSAISDSGSPPGSPPQVWSPDPRQSTFYDSPALDSKGYGRYHDLVERNTSVRSSAYLPTYQQPGYQGPQYGKSGGEIPGQQQQSFIAEMPGSFYQPHQQQQNNNLYPPPLKPQGQTFRAELPADTSLAPPPGQTPQSTPPLGTHPAHQRYSQGSPQPPQGSPQPLQASPQPSQGSFQRSPQPSPRLPAGDLPSRNSSQSSYQITNPDPPNPQRYSSSVEQWQKAVQGDHPIDANYYTNGRPSDTATEPDHQRFSSLSIQQNADDVPAPQTGTRISKCPVCGLFEGDEAAISHHVSKQHFT